MDMRIHLRGSKRIGLQLPSSRHSTDDDPYLDPVGADEGIPGMLNLYVVDESRDGEGRFDDILTLVPRPMWRHVAEALHGIASLIEEQLRDGSLRKVIW